MQKLKVIFMGTPSYATVILEGLLKSNFVDVIALFTQEDKPVGRKKILTPPDTKRFLLEKGYDLPIFQPKRLRDEENVKIIKDLNPDFIIVAAYGQILPKSILDIAPCINLHASVLPKYRGASPIQDAIKNGDKFSGVTAMLMDVGLDTGDILGISFMDIEDLNAPELFEKLSYLAKDLTLDTLKKYERLLPLKQNALLATHCKKIKKEDGIIDFTDAKSLYHTYLAYFYWPNIFLKSGLKLKKISLNDEKSLNEKGKILAVEKDHIVVGCQKGSLKIFQVQPPSKKEMPVVDYLRGKRLSVGDTLL